jgi:hypothetical protein
LVLVEPPIRIEEVPVREASKIKPAVAVVEPPRRRSRVEVAITTMPRPAISIQLQPVPSVRHTVFPPITIELPEAEVKARVVAVALVNRAVVAETEVAIREVEVTVPTSRPNHLREAPPKR